MHDMRDNIHILKKKRKLGVYQAFANSEMHGDPEGLFDFTESLPGQARSFTHRMPRGCVKRGFLCAIPAEIFHTFNQMHTRYNRSFTGPFQTQLPLRWHFYISSHPFPANVKWFAPHFRILSLTKKKKNALCSLLSLDQKALLLMKRNLKNHSLFVFPCPVPPSDIFH